MNRRSLRTKNDAGLLAAGVVTLALVVGLSALALTAQRGLPLRNYYVLRASFRDAGNIEEYSEVRIAGNLVGQVLGSSYRSRIAQLTLQLTPSVEPLRSDTTARIRLKGLLGAKYVELVPGRRGAPLANNATIPVSQTSTAVDVFHVLEALDSRRQVDLQELLGALGEGFLGRGQQLNGALSEAPGLVANIDQVASAVDARTGAASRLVPSAEALTAAVDPVGHALAQGFSPEASALQSFVTERRSVQAMLDEAPGALSTIQQGLAQTDPLLHETTGFAQAAVKLTRVAPGALRRATALLDAAPAPLRGAQALLNHLSGAIPPTLRLTASLSPLITPALRLLTNALPALDTLAARSCDILGFARNWRSMLAWGTGGGGAIGPSNVFRAAPVVNPDTNPAPQKTATLFGQDVYPAPCAAATEHLP
jgi:phospholipid/cholesterol/gamma-HCH transport system substrate-binding protein